MRIFVLLCLVTTGFSQGINTKLISSDVATKVVLSPAVATILQFPAQFAAVYGLGIVGKDAKESGDVQVEYAPNRPVLVLHPLKPHVRNSMTVFMAGKMYVFDLADGDNPDLCVTLRSGAVSESATKVTPETVVDSRPKYAPEMLVSLMDRAQGAALMKVSDPEDYTDYQHRESNYISDDGYVKTAVKDIHKFADADAIVLQGELTNLSDNLLRFGSEQVAISVGNVKHPVTLLSCPRPIAPKASSAFTAVLVGDLDGGKANLSLDNEFRLVVDTGHYKEHAPEPDLPAVPALSATPSPTAPAPLK